MRQLALFLLPTLLLLLSSCSRRLTPLTEGLREENQWSERDLRKIQFYLSEDIVLSRERSSGSSAISDGKVREVSGRTIEEVVFERGTPGVVLFSPKEGHLAIGFDPKDDGRYLVFGPNPKVRGQYTLLASDWSRFSGKVRYDNLVWDVSASHADVHLLLDLRRQASVNRRTQTASGRRID